MARGKKKEVLTLEERLQAALVPESEQPYRVPGNWCWIHLLDSFENKTDSKKKVPQKTYLKQGVLAVVDQGKELVGGYTNEEAMAYSGELPVIVFGDHTRCIKYVDFPFAQGADGVKVLKPKSFFTPRLFALQCKALIFQIWDIDGIFRCLVSMRFPFRPFLSSIALLTESKACLPSWTKPNKRCRMCWTVLKPVKPQSCIKPLAVN